MIYERFTIIIVCSILSSIANIGSNATEFKVFNSSLATDILALSNNRQPRDVAINYNQSSCCRSEDLVVASSGSQLAQNKLETEKKRQPNQSNSSSNVESASTINRHLYLAAMALTSAISLFLIWILFRQPAQKQEEPAILLPKGKENEPKFGIENKLLKTQTDLPTELYSLSGFLPDQITLPNEVDDSLNLLEHSQSSVVDRGAGKIEIASQNHGIPRIDLVSELIRDLQQGNKFQGKADSSQLTWLRERQRQHNLRRKAIWELAKVGDHRSIEPLAKIMSQADSLDRSLISWAITQITNRSFRSINDKLFILLEDKNPEVRKMAIRDLTTLSKFAAAIAQRLEQMQSDPDREVRVEAASALEQLNSQDIPCSLNDYSSHKIDSLPADKTVQEGKANLYLVSPRLDNQESDLEN